MNHRSDNDSKRKNIMLTLILWLFCGCVSMAAMLYAASEKTIVIADTDWEQIPSKENTKEHDPVRIPLLLQKGGDAGQICIPLEKGTKAEDVVMENRYMDRELWIYLKKASQEFYEENVIYGDFTSVEGGYSEKQPGSVLLKLRMTDVLEYRSVLENDTLVIDCYEPKELYSLIVVVDPLGDGGTGDPALSREGRELAVEVAKKLQKKLNQEDIRLYFTCLEPKDVPKENRIGIVEETDADIYIGIGADRDEANQDTYGILSYYNEAYFIPEFGNAELADLLVRKVTISASNRALGIFASHESSILQDLEIPAAQISLGFLTHPEESVLLEQEAYREKLSEGLAEAIFEVYNLYAEQDR